MSKSEIYEITLAEQRKFLQSLTNDAIEEIRVLVEEASKLSDIHVFPKKFTYSTKENFNYVDFLPFDLNTYNFPINNSLFSKAA